MFCNLRAARPRCESNLGAFCPRKAPKHRGQIGFQSGKGSARGCRAKMHNNVERFERIATLPSPVDLAHLPLEPVPNHRATNSAGRGNSQSGQIHSIWRKVDNDNLTMTTASMAVAPLEIRSATEPLLCGDALSGEDTQTVRR